MRHLILSTAALLAACGQAQPDVRAGDAWARETVAGQSAAAAYVTIVNGGEGGDRLIGVEAAPPAEAALHQTTSSNGVSRMRPLPEGLEIPAGETVELRPGGSHIMVTGLTAPLQRGDTLALTLRFERSGATPVEVHIRDPASSGAANHAGMAM